MSHADPGPLATYNSLQDKHLNGYFSNSRMKKHLKKSGLVTKKGKIIDEKTYRLNMAKKEHRKHVRDLLATAIVHKTLDMERIRQYEIRKKLDEAYKVELVRRVKEGRNRKGDEDILPLLSPRERTAKQMRKAHLRERPATAPATFAEHGEEEETHLKPSEIYYDDETQKIYYRVDSSPQHMNGYLKDETEELGPSPYTRAYPATYPAPAPPPSGTPRRTRTLSTQRKGVRLQRFHYLARTEPAVARRVQLQSMAEVTMKFLGPSLVLTNSMFPEDRLSEVMVLQQHCGGSTLCVFRELLPPNTIFTFISRRHRGAPFGLTFYIDGMQDIRLSSCCEYKHKPGHILGGKNGHFQFVVVEGAAPCYRCQIASAHKHSKYKHKNTESSGDVEDDDRSKTFMTETANEQEEEEHGETFDVIITKIQSAGGEDEEIDSGEMVDHSTQTPHDESANKQEELDVDGEKTAGSADSVSGESKQDDDSAEAEESGADKYDDEEFEEGPEKDKENESEGEAKEETDKGDKDKKEDQKDDDYNEDFESDEEKERDKSGVEDEDGKESEKEEDPEYDIQDETEDKEKSEKELHPEDDIEDETEDKEKSEIELRPEDDIEDETEDKEKSEKQLHPEDDIEDETEEKEKSEIELRPEDDIEDETEDKEKSEKELHPEDDIQDETEDTEKSEIGEKEQAEEVEDQTDKEKPDNAGRPTSATDSEGRKSKNVSFDEDVTVIKDEQKEGEKDDEENREDALEEDAEQNDQEDPSVDKAEQESEDLPGKVPSEPPRQGQDDSRYPEEEQRDTVRSPEPSDSSSSSSSSSSESSDSDDESKRARRSKKKKKGKSKSRPDQDPGSDPDLVSSGQLPDQALKAVGVQPGTKHDGSIQSLLEGKEDVELVGVALTKGQFEEVAKIIDSREDLGTVILRNTSADDSALETLAASLINAPTLKMLNLSVNRIGPEGAKHLAGVIRQNKSLRMLLLHGNPLTDEGVGIIIDAIVETTDTSIMNLDLGDCGLTQDGAKHIAKLIRHNSTVTVLTISGNTIQLEGWQNISKALLTNSTLETLSLDFNKIGDEEAISIAEGIQGCKSLRSVDLEGNKIGDEGGRKLFDAVKANKSIVDLTLLPINQISKEIVDEVKDFLKEREKGNEPEEVGVGEEQHETEFSALQPQQDSGRQGLVTEGDRTEASLEEIVNEYTSTQENSEEGQEQTENDGVIIEVDQDEEPPSIVQKEQGREENDKEAEDREQPSGDDQQGEKEDSAAEENAAPAEGVGQLPDAEHLERREENDKEAEDREQPSGHGQQSEKEDSAAEENAAPAEGVGQLPDAEHPEHQDVAPAKDDQDGNEPQQDSHQAPHPQRDPQQNAHQDPHSDPQLEPQQDPQQSENGEGQESSRKEQPQILEDPGESTGQELLGQDEEDKSPQDPAVSVDLGVNDDEKTSKRVSSTKEEGNDNKQEGLENEIEDKQVPGASSPGEDAQNNSSDAAS